jgi:hypothetical protein
METFTETEVMRNGGTGGDHTDIGIGEDQGDRIQVFDIPQHHSTSCGFSRSTKETDPFPDKKEAQQQSQKSLEKPLQQGSKGKERG